MLLPLILALLVALVFYVILPVTGAFIIRSAWRRFRHRAIEVERLPPLGYRDAAPGAAGVGAGEGRSFRLRGLVEALEGDSRVWVRGAGVSAQVDLSGAAIHILVPERVQLSLWAPERAGTVERIPWSRIGVFPEGALMTVGGRLRFEAGRPVFSESPDEELFVLVSEGGGEGLLPRLIAGGRQRNEYWNPLTRFALSMGIGGMGILLAFILRAQYFPSVRFLSLLIALAPVAVLVPPGLLFFVYYRRWWRRGVSCRIIRDLLRLDPAVFGPHAASEESRRSYEDAWSYLQGARRGLSSPESPGERERLARLADSLSLRATGVAGFLLGLGIFLNLALAFMLWRLS